ncbi:hypothetical protein A2962_01150 [Candidatus Woesebacteria bacterium RIFCSPLOWO2_01_FULL_39_61]|nr:MAG: hypothetical protein A2962_01150 [Candidatus Woesebacteria bacterium RIFCSPLOWO2_01_FULL_39_61]
MGDKRVSGWLKLGFLGGSLWVLFPDFVVGPLDDAIVLYFLATWENYCPPWVVSEVREQLEREAREGPQPPMRRPADAGHMPGNQGRTGSIPVQGPKPRAEAEERGKSTGRYCVQNGGEQRFVTQEEIGDSQQVWEEYEIPDPKDPKKILKKWRRYR